MGWLKTPARHAESTELLYQNVVTSKIMPHIKTQSRKQSKKVQPSSDFSYNRYFGSPECFSYVKFFSIFPSVPARALLCPQRVPGLSAGSFSCWGMKKANPGRWRPLRQTPILTEVQGCSVTGRWSGPPSGFHGQEKTLLAGKEGTLAGYLAQQLSCEVGVGRAEANRAGGPPSEASLPSEGHMGDSGSSY